MKPAKFVFAAVIINLVLYLIVYLMPINVLQFVIGYMISAFVYVFGVELAVVGAEAGYQLATSSGRMLLYQSFFEFLTIIALTVPLYLKKPKMLLKKLGIVLGIMLGYYTILYGITIVLLDSGNHPTNLLRFIEYNMDSFMILAFTLVWYVVNRKQVDRLIRQIKR